MCLESAGGRPPVPFGHCRSSANKTFFVLFKNRLPPGSTSIIALDERPGLRPGAEEQLRSCLNGAGARVSPSFTVTGCYAVCSRSEDLVQLADLLCGAVAWDWNGRPPRNGAKQQAHGLICKHLGSTTLHRETYRDPKFGIWRYRPRQIGAA
jgi:hypothetical protein